MTRKRRETITADEVQEGDTITTPSGNKATVYSCGTLASCTEPNVTLGWAWPTDFSVNENFRGQHGGSTYRPGDEITRWV